MFLSKIKLYLLLFTCLAGTTAFFSCKKDEEIPRIDMKITHVQVWELDSRLFIYGQFGPDPGSSQRSVTVHGVPVKAIHQWTPGLIICSIPRLDPGSFGEVVVRRSDSEYATRMLYKWIVRMYYDFPQAGLNGNLKESIEFSILIRGDIGKIPDEVIRYERGQGFLFSYFDYSMSGSGTSTYDQGCSQVHVNWPLTTGTVGASADSLDLSGQSHFQYTITPQDNGYDIRIQADVVNAVQADVTHTSCGGSSSHSTVPQMIDFVTFDNEVIPLRLNGTTIISGGMTPKKVAPTSGLIWDAADYLQNQTTVTLEWPLPTQPYK